MLCPHLRKALLLLDTNIQGTVRLIYQSEKNLTKSQPVDISEFVTETARVFAHLLIPPKGVDIVIEPCVIYPMGEVFLFVTTYNPEVQVEEMMPDGLVLD